MGVIQAIAGHRIAANLLMLLMLGSGLLVINRIEVRFFPAFEVQRISVNASWRGASAEDVSDALLTPLENNLRNVPDIKEIASYARDGHGSVYLEFPGDKDMEQAAKDVRRYVDLASVNLPSGSDRPKIRRIERTDQILRLSLSGDSLAELRQLARRLETQLLRLGVVRVNVSGLPEDEIQIRVEQRRLTELQLGLRDIGRQVAEQNVDATAGSLGSERLLRVVAQGKRLEDFANITIIDGAGKVVHLRDIATIRRKRARNETVVLLNGRPAVEFQLIRKQNVNTLTAAERVLAWVETARADLPATMELTAHGQRWRAVQSRLDLLVENGIQGLLLVLLFLLLFLNLRLAVWVAAGIPATFMVALLALYLSGGTINMISMFAFIMVTGLVVDDAIVVGENGMYHLQRGKAPLTAAVVGAKEMFAAVFSSTFTTIASFMPLLIVGGVIGSILFVIPLVVICVLLASLFECFFVLPGHMAGAFATITKQRTSAWRRALDSAFERFQEGAFRRSITLALRYRWVTVVLVWTLLVLTISLAIGGLLKYRFFPGAELNRVQAEVSFVAGTPRDEVERFMRRLNDSVHETATAFPQEENLVRYISVYLGRGGERQGSGDEKARMVVEISLPEERSIGTRDFVQQWRRFLPAQAGLETLSLREARGGPAGEDLSVRFSGEDNDSLKAAATALRTALNDVPGVSRPKDDMPYGRQQTVFELTSRGRALDLTVRDIAAQLRDAFDGYRVQTLYEGVDEVPVHIQLADTDGAPLEVIDDFRIRLPNGAFVALGEVVNLRSRRGFETIQRVNVRPVVHVVGNVDFKETTVERVVQQLEADILPAIAARHHVQYSFEGGRADERETLRDMRLGLWIALLAIFVILAAVFASWSLPLVILLTIPFGVIGALWGHWLLGYSFSILSAFGVFTLNGIIVNDSIILVRDYLARLKDAPAADKNALIVDAVCRRLRAILLTSLTTVGGLVPLLFERSIQAQFLIPMAVSICFGLAFATLLILYLMPAYVSIHNSIAEFFVGKRRTNTMERNM